MPPKLIAVVGPTASGKTALAIAIARAFGGEIVSADSRQIYRGMDIGTAKAPRDAGGPGAANAGAVSGWGVPVYYSSGIRHHLVDIRDPDADYSVADFKREADAAITDIIRRGEVPILAGGTGLYVKAVVENLDLPKIEADPEIRRGIEADIAARGLAAIFDRLVALDPEAAYIVDPKNPRRVVRALEVAIATGKPFTAQRRTGTPRYETLKLGIGHPPDVLRERINRRIDEMISDNLVGEVRALASRFRAADGSPPAAFDAIGYREIIEYLDGRATLPEAVAAMKLNTWHFAKRQMTWFRKDAGIRWVADAETAIRLTAAFLGQSPANADE